MPDALKRNPLNDYTEGWLHVTQNPCDEWVGTHNQWGEGRLVEIGKGCQIMNIFLWSKKGYAGYASLCNCLIIPKMRCVTYCLNVTQRLRRVTRIAWLPLIEPKTPTNILKTPTKIFRTATKNFRTPTKKLKNHTDISCRRRLELWFCVTLA